MTSTRAKTIHRPILLALFMIFSPAALRAEFISMPLTIDFPLLRSLMVHEAFSGPDESADLINEDDGCKILRVSSPRIYEAHGRMNCEVAISLRLGVSLAGRCRVPLKWDGFLVLLQNPKIDPDTWSLSFETIDSTVLNEGREKGVLLGVAWDLVKSSVQTYMEDIRIDLLPPVNNLKRVIHPLFPEEYKDRAKKLVSSMTPEGILVFPDALRINITSEVQTGLPQLPDESPMEADPEKAKRFVDLWEAWDALFLQMITSLANRPLSEQDRQLLLDVLLENRYEFAAVLAQTKGGEDLVRRQFLTSWEKLSYIFRRHLSTEPSRSLLGYLAFFTASDALAALDAAGPELGIEISRNGLVRMALLLSDDPSITLEYKKGVNKELRTLFDMGQPLEAGDESDFEKTSGRDVQDLKGPTDQNSGPFSYILNRVFPMAHAQTAAPEKSRREKDIQNYLYTTDMDLDLFVRKIRSLMEKTTKNLLQNAPEISSNPDPRPKLLPFLILATAWQESCFRQYVIQKNKPTYIRSYDGTSVGIMQINERVWRNLYEIDSLKWNTAYNAAAGSEILELYLRRYALRKLENKKPPVSLTPERMAGLVYAMYNGGPSQFSAFLKRIKSKDLYLADRLFLEKWRWVEKQSFNHLSQCLLGK